MSHSLRIRTIVNQLSTGNRTSSLRTFSTASNVSSSILRQDLPNGVLLLTLNRPKALNSLNLEMVQDLRRILKEIYGGKKENKVVIFKGEGKCFCAGGDVRALRDSALTKNLDYPSRFLSAEYETDYLVWKLNSEMGEEKKTTVVSFWNGYTMGGGLGLSVGSQIKIVSESTVCSMPETAIGLFPDVGASFFLNRGRLKGALGTYLGLTGVRLSAADCLWSGLATHFVPSSKFQSLEEALKLADFSKEEPLQIVERYSEPFNQQNSFLKTHEKVIKACFEAKSVEEVLKNLRENKMEEFQQWREETLQSLQKLSPTSLNYTFQLFQMGRNSTIEEAYQREYRGCLHFMMGHDFVEGVRAVLVDKDAKPKWNPPSLKQISKEEINVLFTQVKGVSDLRVEDTIRLL